MSGLQATAACQQPAGNTTHIPSFSLYTINDVANLLTFHTILGTGKYNQNNIEGSMCRCNLYGRRNGYFLSPRERTLHNNYTYAALRMKILPLLVAT